jgi:hypothetical protein
MSWDLLLFKIRSRPRVGASGTRHPNLSVEIPFSIKPLSNPAQAAENKTKRIEVADGRDRNNSF